MTLQDYQPSTLPHSAPQINSEVARIVRSQHLRDMLAAIDQWHRATGAGRSYWRGYARIAITRFRTQHLEPERRAFERAVAGRRRSRSYLPGVV